MRKSDIAIVIVGLTLIGWGIYQVLPQEERQLGLSYYKSIQLATDPDNGEVLSTDGTNNVWSSAGAGDITGASNLGTGLNIFDTESAGILRFNSIAAGSNITLSTTSNANTIVIASTAVGGGGATPFESNTSWGALAQATTSRLAFPEGLISSSTIGNLTTGNLTATTSANLYQWLSRQGNLGIDLTEVGSDLVLHANVGGTNQFVIDTDGAFLEITANPGAANDYEMFAFEETQGDDTVINFYEEGTGHNRIWNSGSMRLGGVKGSLCSTLAGLLVDCDTPLTGADLVVQDDIQAFGTGYFSSINATSTSYFVDSFLASSSIGKLTTGTITSTSTATSTFA